MKNFTSAISGETVIVNMDKIVFIEQQNDKNSMWTWIMVNYLS